MKRFNLSGPQDVMALLVRRKWWIVFPFLALSCAVLLFTYMLPKMYVSETLVQIQSRDVPKEFVKDLIGGSAGQRLKTIEQTVLSRSVLLQIVHEFDYSIPEFRDMNNDQKIASLRDSITLDFNQEIVGGEVLPVSYFKLSYKNRNPELAQKVAAKVTLVFIEQDNQARESKVSGTTTFLSDALAKVSVQLTESDTKLKNLKGQRRFELPDQTPINLANLTRLEDARKANLEAADRSQAQLTQLQQVIAATPAKLTKPVVAPVVPPVPKNPQVEDYLKTLEHRNSLIARGLTDKHPDVNTDDRHLESLKKQIPPAVLAAALAPKEDKPPVETPTVITEDNPAYQNLKTTEALLINEIKIRKAAVADTQTDIETYKKRVQNGPQSEQDLAEIQRQNTDLNKQYKDLKDQLTQAQLSESLETRQQGSQFMIRDAANLPLSPTKPAKPAIAAAGIMASLMVGLFLAIVVDVANQKMWTLSDVEALLGTTVLVEIPEIVTAADLDAARRKKRFFALSVSVLSAVYCAGLYMAYSHQHFVLVHLEPVIKRLY